MEYHTKNTLQIYGADEKQTSQIIGSVKHFFEPSELEILSKSNGCYFETQHYWDQREWNFFEGLARQFAEITFRITREGVIEHLFNETRLKGNQQENHSGNISYGPWRIVLLPEEKKDIDVNKMLYDALGLLETVKHSGYWPFASPNPSSTEARLKKSIESASENIRSALVLDNILFGNTNRPRMECVSMEIKDAKES